MQKGRPTWDGFVQLAIHLSVAHPALDTADPAYPGTDVATAAAEFRRAKARLYIAIKNAYRDGCPLPDIARAANVEPVEIASVIADIDRPALEQDDAEEDRTIVGIGRPMQRP